MTTIITMVTENEKGRERPEEAEDDNDDKEGHNVINNVQRIYF